MDEFATDLWLVCRVRACQCALPLDLVVETMRPLPIEPVAGSPEAVRGLSIIRGTPLPVIDVAVLLGQAADDAGRFVVVRVGDRQAALAVDCVLGVRRAPRASLHAPPLVCGGEAQAIAAVGLLDAQLLLVLRSARLLPEDLAQAEVPQ